MEKSGTPAEDVAQDGSQNMSLLQSGARLCS